MDATEFDNIPLLQDENTQKASSSSGKANQSEQPKRRTVRFSEDSDTPRRRLRGNREDPFDLTDEEFEKLSLFRSSTGSSSAFTFGGVFWMVASIWTLYYTQLPIVIKADDRVDWFWLTLAAIMLAVCLSTASYFIVYLSWIKKVSSNEWEKYFPPGIPICTATFLLFSLFLNLALWPVFRFFTPLILLTQFMGAVTFIAIFP